MNRRTLVNNNEAPTKTLTKSISKKTKCLARLPLRHCVNWFCGRMLCVAIETKEKMSWEDEEAARN